MGFDVHEPEERSQLNRTLRASDITVSELWLRYFSMSGMAGEYEVPEYVEGLISLPALQRDLLAMAADERTASPREPWVRRPEPGRCLLLRHCSKTLPLRLLSALLWAQQPTGHVPWVIGLMQLGLWSISGGEPRGEHP
jgi:hypothetical protein